MTAPMGDGLGPGSDGGDGAAAEPPIDRRPGLIGDPFAEIFERGGGLAPRPASWPAHPASLPSGALLAQCRVGRERTGGPGGQHRNKVETAVVLTHLPTGMTAQAGERRSVRENHPVAVRRLRLELATHHRVEVPLGEARTPLWVSRTPGRRIVCAVRHADFPSMLAEAMDMMQACAWDPRRAATRLEVSPSQLVRFIRDHPPAFAVVNEARSRRGLHGLH